MTLLSRYLVAEQLRVLMLTLTALSGVHLAVSILDKLRTFMAHDASAGVFLQFFGLQLPKVVAEIVPFSLLIATVVGLGMLSTRSEITAMQASGVSLLRLILPLLMVGLLVSGFFSWAASGLIPRANALSARVMTQVTHPDSSDFNRAVMTRDRIWFRTRDHTIVGVRTADLSAGVMSGVRILQTDGAGRVVRLTTARRMEFIDNGWVMIDGQMLAEEAGSGQLQMQAFDREVAPITRAPDTLQEVDAPRQQMTSSRLRAYIDRLRSDGYQATPYQVELAQRMAMPFASLMMVLVAIPYGLTRPRSHSLARGIGISLAIGVSFWLLSSLSLALGRAEVLDPLLAAWLPLGIFAAYGTHRILGIQQ